MCACRSLTHNACRKASEMDQPSISKRYYPIRQMPPHEFRHFYEAHHPPRGCPPANERGKVAFRAGGQQNNFWPRGHAPPFHRGFRAPRSDGQKFFCKPPTRTASHAPLIRRPTSPGRAEKCHRKIKIHGTTSGRPKWTRPTPNCWK